MFKLGITSLGQLKRSDRREGRLISAGLLASLDGSGEPDGLSLRKRIIRSLVLPNTTGKTTWSGRFAEIDAELARILENRFPDSLTCLDLGVSDGSTSLDLFGRLQDIRNLCYVLSDLNQSVYVRRRSVWTDVCDDDGNLIQVTIGPFVIPITTLRHMHPLQLVNRALYAYVKVFRAAAVRKACLVFLAHCGEGAFKREPLLAPEVQERIACDSRLRFQRIDLFNPPSETYDFVRMMNLLNVRDRRFGFSDKEIRQGLRSLLCLAREGGVVLIGRTVGTHSGEPVTQATLFEKAGKTLHLLHRFGPGSELESYLADIEAISGHSLS